MALPHDASTTDVKVALETGLQTGSVGVSRSGPDRNGGFVWTVAFDDLVGNVDNFRVTSDLTGARARVEANETRQGTQQEIQAFAVQPENATAVINGEFVLSMPAYGSLPEARSGIVQVSAASNCSSLEQDVRDAMEGALSGAAFGSVSVSCSGSPQAGLSFNATFLQKAGDLPQVDLLATADALSGSIGLAAYDPASVASTTIQDGDATALGGVFALSFKGQRTAYMPYNASSVIVEAELEELATVGDVSITRALVGPSGDYTWTVTFEDNLGDLPLLEIDTKSLTGTLPQAVVEEVVRGAPPPFNQGQGGLPLGA